MGMDICMPGLRPGPSIGREGPATSVGRDECFKLSSNWQLVTMIINASVMRV
jgi:hypothetical protein